MLNPMNLFIAICLLLSTVSCAGSIKNSSTLVDQENADQLELAKKEGLVNWESKPQTVDQGNGLQLLLQASEGMSFIYAAHKENGGQDLF